LELTMPAKSKKQYRFWKALENSAELREEKGISSKTAKEYTAKNKGSKSYKKLPESK